ncbi:MAG: hypothetical protein GWN86_11490 [Desulfobacterales bacterium]|nr:hypothetical protein [Desulfobacterales bacterium]
MEHRVKRDEKLGETGKEGRDQRKELRIADFGLRILKKAEDRRQKTEDRVQSA